MRIGHVPEHAGNLCDSKTPKAYGSVIAIVKITAAIEPNDMDKWKRPTEMDADNVRNIWYLQWAFGKNQQIEAA